MVWEEDSILATKHLGIPIIKLRVQILFASMIQNDGFWFETHQGFAMFDHLESTLIKIYNLHGFLEDTSDYFACGQQRDTLHRVTRIEYLAAILARNVV